MALLPISSQPRQVDECIYCGASEVDLSREHAVPYGLNGPWTLLRASCQACADVTHRFERDALKGLFPAIRAVLAFQTRRPRDRSKTLPLVIENHGQQREIRLALEDYPLYLPSPVWLEPGVIAQRPVDGPIAFRLEFRHLAGPSFESVANRFQPCDFVGARVSFAPQEFARMIAKVAFCAAVHAIGLAPIRQSPIRAIILGHDPAVAHWVGAWSGPEMNVQGGLHAIQIRTVGAQIHVVVRLFAQFKAPEYHVVLGEADRDFVNSNAWPWRGEP